MRYEWKFIEAFRYPFRARPRRYPFFFMDEKVFFFWLLLATRNMSRYMLRMNASTWNINRSNYFMVCAQTNNKPSFYYRRQIMQPNLM